MRPLRFAAFLLTLSVMAGPVAADTLVTLNESTDAFEVAGQKQPASKARSFLWIGSGKARQDDERTGISFIYRGDIKKAYFVHTKKKIYNTLDLPIDASKLMPPEMGQVLQQMGEMTKMTAKVTPTAETKKIRDWNATRHVVEISNPMGLQIKIDLWASTEPKIDLAAYRGLDNSMKSLQPGYDSVVKEMERIEGFPVLSEITVSMQGTQTKQREEMISVETKEAPVGTYDPPAGFEEKPFDYMALAAGDPQEGGN